MSKKIEFIDLGLPSGRLWTTENEEGYYTYDEAKEKFGELLPKPEAFQELWEEGRWFWDVKNKGMIVVGPNKNTIFLSASGYHDYASGGLSNVNSYGFYWSYASCSQDNAHSLSFYSGGVYSLDTNFIAFGFSVRLCREI